MTEGQAQWRGPGEKPHKYSPDYMAMGDCSICGHTREAHEKTTPAGLAALAAHEQGEGKG